MNFLDDALTINFAQLLNLIKEKFYHKFEYLSIKQNGDIGNLKPTG